MIVVSKEGSFHRISANQSYKRASAVAVVVMKFQGS